MQTKSGQIHSVFHSKDILNYENGYAITLINYLKPTYRFRCTEQDQIPSLQFLVLGKWIFKILDAER